MISRTALMGILIAAALGGYPLLASLLTLVGAGDDVRLPSIMFRLLVGLLALWVLWANRRSIRMYQPVLLVAGLLFWTLYVFRIIDEGYLSQVASPFDPIELLAWTALFVLAPTVPMFIGLNPMSTATAYRLFTALGALTVLVLLLESRGIAMQLMDIENARFSVEKLNPISVGYVGGTFMLMCAVGLFRPWKKPGVMAIAFFGLGAVGGLFTLLISASRGPALATAIALLAYALIPPRFGRIATTAGLAMLGGGLIVAMRSFVYRTFEIDVFARFVDAGSDYDGSAMSRESSFSGAWQQFLENPLLGESLVEKSTTSYAHNSVLEALMATGIFGGLAFLLCMLLAVLAAVRLLAREDGYEWLALLALFYMIGALFSGAHYSNTGLWVTMIAVVVTEVKMRAVSHSNRARRSRRHAEEQALSDERDAAPRNYVEGQLMNQERHER